MLRFPNETAMKEALALYREKTTPLHTFAPYAKWDDVADAFNSGFSTALQVDFVHDTLSHSEWELANRLVEEKYSKLEWRKQRISLTESL
jgi:lipoate-protein ligase A